jgi:hypothetical protein
MKKLFQILISLTFLLTFNNCDNIGDNDLNPEVEKDPAVELSAVLLNGTRNAMLQAFTIGNNAAQLTANTTNNSIEIYNWVGLTDTWFNVFGAIIGARNLELIGRETNNPNYEAAGIILRTWLFSILTDAYGDIPYTQGAQSQESGILFPKYDSQEQVYTGSEGLLAELRRANGLITTSGNALDAEADFLYGGDMSKWKKFCNSLRLRLLMRVSSKVNVSQEMQEIVNEGAIFTNVDDGAHLRYSGDNAGQHPIFNLGPTDFEEKRLSQTALDYFLTYNDPRLGQYARPTQETLNSSQPEYLGWVSGADGCDPDNKASLLGFPYFDFPGYPIVGQDARSQGILMTHAEVELLLAEAAQKGLISGSVEDHYKAGIQSSLDFYNADLAAFGWTSFDDFYDNSGVAYQNQPQKIMEQKWIALYFTGLEPYFDLRRRLAEFDYDWDQIPFLSPSCNNSNGNRLPLRFTYPEQEEQLNRTNYEEAVNRMGGNSQNTEMWLLVN